jgi:hypothetical protein
MGKALELAILTSPEKRVYPNPKPGNKSLKMPKYMYSGILKGISRETSWNIVPFRWVSAAI